MYAQIERLKEHKSWPIVNAIAHRQSAMQPSFKFADNRPMAIAQLLRISSAPDEIDVTQFSNKGGLIKKRISKRVAARGPKGGEIDQKNILEGKNKKRRKAAPVRLMYGPGLGYPHTVSVKAPLKAIYGSTIPAQKNKPHLPWVDFSAFVINGYSCKIQYTGNRKKDYAIAEKKYNITHTPGTNVWHHVADYAGGKGTLQLLPYDIHNAIKHRGGVEQATSSGDFAFYS